MRAVAETAFTIDDVVKPVVSYLAANLHKGKLRLDNSFEFFLTSCFDTTQGVR